MLRRLLPVVILAALAGGGYYAWLRFRPAPQASAEKLPIHVVDRGKVELLLKETGTVAPRQTVAVKSKVSGRVAQVLVVEGEEVKTGQLLAVVEPDAQASVTLSQKRLDLRRLAIELKQKEREHLRQSRLLKEGLVAAQVAEEAERDYLTAQSLFQQALTSLNLMEREANLPETRSGAALTQGEMLMTDYRILAPIDGIVASVKVKPGELATSGTTGFSQEGALLLEIADQSTLEVTVDVNEIDVPRIHTGMDAAVTLAARPGKPVKAAVDRVAVAPRTTDNKLVVYPVVLRLLERPPELRQGMTGTVDVVLETVEDAVRIPVLSFEERDGKAWVKIQGADGALADREVVLGLRGDRFAEVKKGLDAKDTVAARYPRKKDAA